MRPMKPPLDPKVRSHLIEEGARLLATKEFFGAHEAFEDLWIATGHARHREVWQGLSQVAAALVKHEKGEPTTAISILAKARARLKGGHFEGAAAEALGRYLDALADAVTAERHLPDTALPSPLLQALLVF